MLIGVTPAAAQETSSLPHIGFLGTSANNGLTLAFQRGLRDHGYIEGENILVDYRFNGARADLLPGLAQELVDLQPDAIVAGGAISAQALKQATSTIPIIFAINPDPVSIGLVDNDERPSANLTGFSSVDPDEYIHDLQSLQRLIPGLSRVASIADQDIADNVRAGQFPMGDREAKATGLELLGIGIRADSLDLDTAFQTITDGGAQAILVLQQPVTGLYRAQIAERAMSAGLPALFWADAADDQWVATYGTSLNGAAWSTAAYLDEILQGTPVAELPVQNLATKSLVVNLGAARELGLDVPPELLNEADRVIGQ